MATYNYPNLNKLMNPKTIAVIGASTDPEKIGGRPISRSLKHGTIAKIYAVNPRVTNGKILGYPCYASVGDIPDTIDLAIIALPANLVINSVKECIKKKVPFGIIFASGFGEMGEEGKKYENEIIEVAKQGNLRLVGPNCQGIINLQKIMIASFTPALAIERLTPGNIGFVSQSGAFGGSVFNFVQQRHIGLSLWISIGNQADIDVWDCFNYMIEDKDTLVMSGYLEGIKNGNKMLDVAEKANRARKPLILLRGGTSKRGAKAVLSHTGNIANSSKIVSSAFAQKGIIEVQGVEELFDIATLFAELKEPIKDGIGILTTSGAAGVLMADQCEKYGLNLANLSETTKKKLRDVLPDYGSVENPVDLTAQMINNPAIFTDALDIFLEDDAIGLVIIMFTMVVEDLAMICANKIAKEIPRRKKPAVMCWMATKLADDQIEIIREAKIPIYETPFRCIRSVNAVIKYNQYLSENKENSDVKLIIKKNILPSKDVKTKTIDIFRARQKDQNKILTEYEAKNILQMNGFNINKGNIAYSQNEAITIAKKIGYPVVIKVDSHEILHKSDAGAIQIDIKNDDELMSAYNNILKNARCYKPNAEIKKVVILEMIKEVGVECIVGGQYDTDFGWALMFGFGGIFVEIFKDVSMRIIPLSRSDAKKMIKQTKGYQLLEGVRGQKQKDIEGLVDFMLQTANFIDCYGTFIEEFEINPLIVLSKGRGVFAADCLMILK